MLLGLSSPRSAPKNAARVGAGHCWQAAGSQLLKSASFRKETQFPNQADCSALADFAQRAVRYL